MVSGQIFSIGALVAGTPLDLTLDYRYDETAYDVSMTFGLVLRSPALQRALEVGASTDFGNDTVQLNAFGLHDPLTACLVACASAAVVKPLIDCYRSRITPQEYIDCLRKHGHAAVGDVIDCAIKCFGSNP
ncbi:hypothetical protein YK56LOC_60180 [Caballeronia sp. HLA56]